LIIKIVSLDKKVINNFYTVCLNISQRIARYLEKFGLVERDMENSFLNLPLDDEVNPDG
jgi:hypothetical protein